jgi:transcription elongation factor Elf1
MNEVTWTCPHCQHENVDLKKETCQPMCGVCEKHFDWEALWHVSDDQDEYLNMVDDLSQRLYGKAAVDLTECSDEAVHSLQDDFSNSVKHDIALANVAKLANIS